VTRGNDGNWGVDARGAGDRSKAAGIADIEDGTIVLGVAAFIEVAIFLNLN
jgi:hypothetical protein